MTETGMRLRGFLLERGIDVPEAIAAIEAEASVDGFREGLEHAKATYVPDAIAAERARIRAAVEAVERAHGGTAGHRAAVLAAIEGAER